MCVWLCGSVPLCLCVLCVCVDGVSVYRVCFVVCVRVCFVPALCASYVSVCVFWSVWSHEFPIVAHCVQLLCL